MGKKKKDPIFDIKCRISTNLKTMQLSLDQVIVPMSTRKEIYKLYVLFKCIKDVIAENILSNGSQWIIEIIQIYFGDNASVIVIDAPAKSNYIEKREKKSVVKIVDT